MRCKILQKIITITDLRGGAGQIVNNLAGESIFIMRRGHAAAMLVSAERYAQIESDRDRMDELELAGMVEDARIEYALRGLDNDVLPATRTA
jgi:PHD/YefM family antitoxin component YafN of YafNO toxin-antitoxin module